MLRIVVFMLPLLIVPVIAFLGFDRICSKRERAELARIRKLN